MANPGMRMATREKHGRLLAFAAQVVCDDAGEPEAYEITYMTFYAYNGRWRAAACA